MLNGNEITIRPLRVLQLRDSESVWARAARKLNHKPPMLSLRSDVVVLRPEIPKVFQRRNEKDMFVLAALGVVMSDIYHICLLSLIGDEEIVGITNVEYGVDQIVDAIMRGQETSPCLPMAELLYGHDQLLCALRNQELRKIPLIQK